MDKAPSKKAKVFCWILVLLISLVCLLAGIVVLFRYSRLKNNCTSEVTGTVVYEGSGSRSDRDPIENKYVSSEYWRQIQVETDGRFMLRNVYSNRGAEKKGDEISIHYDPDDPDTYYIGDEPGEHKATAVFLIVASTILPLFTLFIMAKSKKYYKSREQKQ